MNEITLHQPPMRSWGSPNASPFCTKLETYLRMTEVPYKTGKFARGQAPKGKIPYVGIDGTHVGDSQLVIEELERRLAKAGKQPLDGGLSAQEAALGRLARRTLEEAVYFVAMMIRWRTDDGYRAMRDEFKKMLPGFVMPLIRRNVHGKLAGQGTGRHTLEEAMAMGAADFAAIAELLGNKPFFLGDKPRTVDCTLFAFVEGVLAFPVDSALKASVGSHENLVAYRQRIRDRWWKDLG
ncbi:MAG: glutathione S-transferase C-terminal domain-containing protein [Deltaproteobacteria bacterium]|nr:glutathione S-transferase C-terminal domain-containing protein [Deltaproteobacteria bacterium]MDQ3297555.1 glutathione S-transferase C-terminal domain-containing protein [Myxococcota bacterium]